MRNSPSMSVYLVSIMLSAGVCGPAARASDTVRVELDMFSGMPNPVCTLRDSQDVAVIKDRVARYEILSALSWSGCPQPRSGPGYRGVKIGAGFDPQTYAMASGGALLICPRGPDCGSYCDYRCELERMALRACEREKLMSAGIRAKIPDSLFLPVSHDGLFTMRQSDKEAIADFSLMRKYQVIPWDDTVLVQDIVLTAGTAGLKLTAYYGIADMGQKQGFGPVMAPELSLSAAESTLVVYRKRFDEMNVAIPASGFKASVTIDETQSGHFYCVRTSEGGYCALVTAGHYLGGIDRYHFYYYYTSGNSFGATTATTVPPRQGLVLRSKPVYRSVVADLQGRAIRSGSAGNVLRWVATNGRIELQYGASGKGRRNGD